MSRVRMQIQMIDPWLFVNLVALLLWKVRIRFYVLCPQMSAHCLCLQKALSLRIVDLSRTGSVLAANLAEKKCLQLCYTVRLGCKSK